MREAHERLMLRDPVIHDAVESPHGLPALARAMARYARHAAAAR